MYRKWNHYFKHNPRTLLLADSIGAILTAFMLLCVLLPLQEYIGMPLQTLLLLGLIAIIFAAYSFGNYRFAQSIGPAHIKIISLANFSYCLVTFSLVWYHYHHLSSLGIAYFLAEILLVCALANLEWRTAADI